MDKVIGSIMLDFCAGDWKWRGYRATSGGEKPHPGLTGNWVIRQFSTKKEKTEQEYRQSVKWGIGKGSIWKGVKGQALLGEEGFVEGLIDHLRKHKDEKPRIGLNS